MDRLGILVQGVLDEFQGDVPKPLAGHDLAQPFTERENVDWAFCTPVPSKSCPGWALYAAGRFDVEQPGLAGSSDPNDLREDVKFTELVAATLSSLRQMRTLERQHASLSQFFSPVVLETLAVKDPELVLAPRQTVVSVLFCDLRGFSLQTQRHADDLLGLLERVSKALGVMTHHIRDQGGVVGDFHGDAAMGFWGWPVVHDDAVLRVCRAALAVGGAKLLDVRNSHVRGEHIVRYRLDRRRFECVCDERLHIIDSGICLRDEHTGEQGDRRFTLESLPAVVRQAEREGRLVIFRHV
jgi:class 3 adenylate cyclase